ncbi:replicative DNA helicase [Anaerorhabdus furcosa]|uniref:Replicative DNA helicase n=1 Tax=Anaerorhabdus furcosa TaxID=118967 RepID=A0A1T4K5D8_9FIRM|nr:replicative DNA helicase [Anaerorhabdus furcosa]SJZ37626.1 replicative DNA helicase [Anaerorhabdus furcosa]
MIRQMPNSLEAEQSLLGTLMVYSNSLTVVMDSGLGDSDFYLDAHRKIYSAIFDLHSEGKPVDMTTVSARLNDTNRLSQVGGVDYLMQLCDAAVTSANTKSYVEIIQNKSYMRNLIEASQNIAEEGFEGQVDIDDYLDSAEKLILSVTRNRRTTDFRSGTEVINSVIENIQKMSDNHSPITGVATGFKDLDRLTHGFQPGDLVILAARPSMGKTAFALNLGMNIAQINTKKAIAIFSLEMPAEQLISRILAAKSTVMGDHLKTGFLSTGEWNQLSEAVTELKSTKIFIDDTPGVRVSEIFSKCRKLEAEHGLQCIIIDYIQLISGSGSKSSDNRQQEVSEISRNLKALARELKVPVIALSQLSRGVEARTDKRPMMSDLRESGALEQDADIIMLLFRESYYNEEKKEESIKNGIESVEVDIAKHRNGATRKIDVAFKADINAFYNIDKSQQ